MLISVELNIFIFIFLGECKGMFPSDAHLTNELLYFSSEEISSNENKRIESLKGIEASAPKLSSNSENDLLKDLSWVGKQSFVSYLEPTINFIPVDDHHHHSEVVIEASNQLPPYLFGDDLFEGTGWDGKQTLASLLEPGDSLDSLHCQNHPIVSAHYMEDAVPLKNLPSTDLLNAEQNFNQPSTGQSSEVAKKIRPESFRSYKSLMGVKKIDFKKQYMPLNLKIIGTPLHETIGEAQSSFSKSIENTSQMVLPESKKFTSFWWQNVYLVMVTNSIVEEKDATLELQVFFDKMNELADDLMSSYKDETFWEKMNMDFNNCFTKSVAEERRSDNFKTNFGEFVDQGDEPYHISLIEKLKKNVLMAGSPPNLSRFLPLFDAMEFQGQKFGSIYISSKAAQNFFMAHKSVRDPMDCLGKVQGLRVNESFYQALNTQLVDIKLEEYFKNDSRILKDRALLIYIERKVVPRELKVYRKILRSKILMRNLYLVITTLINKLFCEGYDDLKQNFSKRQKDAIEFYDLLWKSFKLAKPNGFIVDTSVLPSVNVEFHAELSKKLISDVAGCLNPNTLIKTNQIKLISVWKFVDLWLINYRADLYVEIVKNSGQNFFRPFICSILHFLIELSTN
ncbi:hypothetical protein BY996DRAFT_3840759 [Phakopsora pachyrhizi]|nr:hypothetical protein BY996DRAFT_3840759 [Phakopsora pachyrhizi]